ncbi:MAG: ATP-binding protein [Sulfuricellaceae bacterium]
MIDRLCRFWPISIRHQLVAGFVLVHTLLMTVLVTELAGHQHDFLQSQSRVQAASLAETLATSSMSWVLSNDVVGLQEVVQSVMRYPNARYAMLLTPDGRVLAHNDPSRIGRYLQDATSRSLLTGAPTLRTLVSGDKLVDMAAPVMAGERFLGWARIGLGQEHITENLHQVKIQGVSFTLAAVALGALFATLMANWLTKRLKLLVAATEQVRAGQRGFRIDFKRKDEIGKLGDDFNLMIKALEDDEEHILITQKELRFANARLNGIIDGSPDLIAALDTNYHYIAFNDAFKTEFEKIFGKEIHLGMSLFEALAHLPEEMENTVALWTRALDGESFTLSSEFGSSALQRNIYELSFSPIRDDGGKIIGAAHIVRDITERKRAAEDLAKKTAELARSNQELEQFAYIASHDLQEPLRMVSSYVQLLARRYQGKLDQDADEFIHYAVDGATRMQRLITDLLSYSRVGTRGKAFEPIDGYQVLAAALDNLQLAIADNAATITHDPLPTVTADSSQLTQLFQNLIGNAIKFHGEQPPAIHIGAQQHGDEWLFSIRDNGIGIAPENFERIFLIFQRLHTREEYPGTGIGLAVCKRIVERHGGRIWLESQPGQGTTFFFTLPVSRFNLETSVERAGVCGFPGAGQGATTRNGHSIARSCNAAMHPENRAIQPVALSPNGHT